MVLAMDIEERLSLITRYPTEEVLTVDELRQYLETGVKLKHYIGFEISGYIHIGTGIVSLSKVVDLQRLVLRFPYYSPTYTHGSIINLAATLN